MDKAEYILIHPPAERLFIELDLLFELFGNAYIENNPRRWIGNEKYSFSTSDSLRSVAFILELIARTRSAHSSGIAVLTQPPQCWGHFSCISRNSATFQMGNGRCEG